MREVGNLINTGIGIFPNVHNSLYSHAQLSDQRKVKITLRRDELKVMDEDPIILKIVIEEILSYKPRFFTLDDRYLQLEKILDAIEKARVDKNTDRLLQVCSEIHNQLLK